MCAQPGTYLAQHPPMQVKELRTSVYRIPTDGSETDGTIAWDATTLVLVEAVADSGLTGLGFSYASGAAATLVHDALQKIVVDRPTHELRAVWGSMVAQVRNMGRPGVASTAISAVDVAL